MGDLRGFENGLVLDTDVVLSRSILSPLAIARGRRAGRMEFAASLGGAVFLEVGGTLVAEGRIVKKGGKSWFKVTRLAPAPSAPPSGASLGEGREEAK